MQHLSRQGDKARGNKGKAPLHKGGGQNMANQLTSRVCQGKGDQDQPKVKSHAAQALKDSRAGAPQHGTGDPRTMRRESDFFERIKFIKNLEINEFIFNPILCKI